MTKAEICSKVRPAVSILPLTKHKMTDKCKSGRAYNWYYNNYTKFTIQIYKYHPKNIFTINTCFINPTPSTTLSPYYATTAKCCI